MQDRKIKSEGIIEGPNLIVIDRKSSSTRKLTDTGCAGYRSSRVKNSYKTKTVRIGTASSSFLNAGALSDDHSSILRNRPTS